MSPETFNFPKVFRLIPYFFADLIHASKSVCMARLSEEMVYWSVAEAWLDNCCRLRLEVDFAFFATVWFRPQIES